MLNAALKFLKAIEDNGYEAYIVGGFVRDYLLGIESNDIDICTNARPSDIRKIFKDSCLPNQEYGSVVVVIKNVRFEVTTFRREITYVDNRKPVEFEYTLDKYEDYEKDVKEFLTYTGMGGDAAVVAGDLKGDIGDDGAKHLVDIDFFKAELKLPAFQSGKL